MIWQNVNYFISFAPRLMHTNRGAFTFASLLSLLFLD